MSKVGIIIKREYTSRVFNKTFLLVTLLTPLAFGLLMFFSGYMAVKNSDTKKRILISDEAGMVNIDSLKDRSSIYVKSTQPLNEIKKTYIEKGYDILLSIPKPDSLATTLNIDYYSKEKMSITQIERMESKIEDQFREYKIQQLNIDRTLLSKIEVNAKFENAMLKESDESIKGDKSSKFASTIATGLSYVMGFLMYMVIFIFGSLVMRSVMEEKINRIVEVMISSVKPFELMLGKVIGVGLVGLTQLILWLILIPLIAMVVSMVIGADAAASSMQAGQAAEAMKQLEGEPNMMATFMSELKQINWTYIIPVFVLYFFGGYFIYSTLFAAAGSAVGDDLSDAQQLIWPLTIPVIIGFVMIGGVIENPNGGMAIFGSMFPLLSPILMPARLPFEPPIWQVGLSLLFLILGILFFSWIAGRIYRVGILMYGKKVGFKEIAKWVKMG